MGEGYRVINGRLDRVSIIRIKTAKNISTNLSTQHNPYATFKSDIRSYSNQEGYTMTKKTMIPWLSLMLTLRKKAQTSRGLLPWSRGVLKAESIESDLPLFTCSNLHRFVSASCKRTKCHSSENSHKTKFCVKSSAESTGR